MTPAPIAHSPQAAADLTGLTLARVMRLIRTRELPAKVVGGRGYLVMHADLEKFIRGLPDA